MIKIDISHVTNKDKWIIVISTACTGYVNKSNVDDNTDGNKGKNNDGITIRTVLI